jgi:hypothetical protein
MGASPPFPSSRLPRVPRPCVCVFRRHRAGILTSYPDRDSQVSEGRAPPPLSQGRLFHHIRAVSTITDPTPMGSGAPFPSSRLPRVPRPCVCVFRRHRAGILTSYPDRDSQVNEGRAPPPLSQRRLFHHIRAVSTITDPVPTPKRESFPDRSSEACARLQRRPKRSLTFDSPEQALTNHSGRNGLKTTGNRSKASKPLFRNTFHVSHDS